MMVKNKPNNRNWLAATCLALLVLTIATYWGVWKCDFVNYDDDVYVTSNRHVQAGLTAENVRWAMTTIEEANWHPLTWISLMADAQDGEVSAERFHTTSLLLHLANTLLLFLLLRRMAKSIWRSALVAALFAVHPLHVESVAWVAERKDVLSTLFWLLTTWAYVLYTEKPGIKRYVPVFILFTLGLMTKPMLVTLPFALLLLDYWPLNRRQKGPGTLVLEKIPLFVLVVASCAVTFYAQRNSGAVQTLAVFPIGVRAANALVAYAGYIWKMLWPANLAAIYPHPGISLPVSYVLGSLVLLLGLTALALWVGRRHKYLIVGWLWYLGTLIPVIGLVQVGGQSMADRYSYVPLIGLFIAIAWAIPELHDRRIKIAASTVLCAVVLALSIGAHAQTKYWHDGYSLFTHALDVTNGNWLAHNNLGNIYRGNGDMVSAEEEYRQALDINPSSDLAHLNLCTILSQTGRPDEAVAEGETAVRIAPNNFEAHNNLAIAYASLGRLRDCIAEFRKVVEIKYDYPKGHFNLGRALMLDGQHDEAMKEYRVCISQQPDFPEAHGGLAAELFLHGDLPGAWAEIHECERLGGTPDPNMLAALSQKMPDPGR